MLSRPPADVFWHTLLDKPTIEISVYVQISSSTNATGSWLVRQTSSSVRRNADKSLLPTLQATCLFKLVSDYDYQSTLTGWETMSSRRLPSMEFSAPNMSDNARVTSVILLVIGLCFTDLKPRFDRGCQNFNRRLGWRPTMYMSFGITVHSQTQICETWRSRLTIHGSRRFVMPVPTFIESIRTKIATMTAWGRRQKWKAADQELNFRLESTGMTCLTRTLMLPTARYLMMSKKRRSLAAKELRDAL